MSCGATSEKSGGLRDPEANLPSGMWANRTKLAEGISRKETMMMQYTPVTIEPWKSVLMSFACIPAALGIADRGFVLATPGWLDRERSSDMYPSQRECRGRNNSNLDTQSQRTHTAPIPMGRTWSPLSATSIDLSSYSLSCRQYLLPCVRVRRPAGPASPRAPSSPCSRARGSRGESVDLEHDSRTPAWDRRTW